MERKNSGPKPGLTFAGVQQGSEVSRDCITFPRKLQWHNLAEVGASFEALLSRKDVSNKLRGSDL